MNVLLRIGLLILSLAIDARAAEKWGRLRTEHFELFTTRGESVGRRTIQHFEQVREFFQTALGVQPDPAAPVRIILFAHEREYAAFRPAELAAAYHTSRRDHEYIVMGATPGSAERIAVHEYMHLLMKLLGMNPPLAVSEGLAELYSTIRPQGNQVLLGDPVPGHVARLRQSPWVDLSLILAADRNSREYNHRDLVGAFYAESWALMHLLFFDRRYREGNGLFLRQVGEGKTAREALESVYGRPLAEIDKDLRTYVQNSRFAGELIPVQWAKAADPPRVTQPTPGEIQLVLARLEHEAGSGPAPGLDARALPGSMPALLTAAEKPEDLGRAEGPLVPNPERVRVQAVESKGPELPVAEGVLTRFECLGEQARITVGRNGVQIQLWIEDPGAVRILGADASTAEFRCGPQSRNVRVAYHATHDLERKTAGAVASLEFLP
jgi:hypothetical protein